MSCSLMFSIVFTSLFIFVLALIFCGEKWRMKRIDVIRNLSLDDMALLYCKKVSCDNCQFFDEIDCTVEVEKWLEEEVDKESIEVL